jgi:uncharacterized protein (DUF934 family)
MPLIRDGQIVQDEWVWVADTEPVPDDAPAVVSLTRWREERASLSRRHAELGVRLVAGDDVADIAEDVANFGLIALEFPTFADGRAYSSARLLRERHGFTGELRAVGNVLRDQFSFMHRCGFDAFEVKDADTAAWRSALGEVRVWYQPAADRRISAMHLRHRRAAAE